MHPRVIEAVSAVMRDAYGNPSSQHAKGRAARALLDESRAVVAEAVGAFPDEIYFTSGGTEANNLAITGSCSAYARDHGRAGAVVTSALEHPSVTKTVRGLKRDGWTVFYLDARDGELDLSGLDRILDEVPDVVLATVMSVQSELGYRFPIEDVVRRCRAVGCARKTRGPLVHTDAVQAFGKLPLDVHELDADLLSFCAHKVGGPKGVGALYVRRGTRLFTTAFGGGQERGLRSGTENVPAIAGMGKAAEEMYQNLDTDLDRMYALKQRLADGISTMENVRINGLCGRDSAPHVLSVSFAGVRSEVLLHALEEREIYVSAGSACASNHPDTAGSATLRAIGLPKELLNSTIRFSLSVFTTEEEIDYTVQVLHELVPMLRRFTRR